MAIVETTIEVITPDMAKEYLTHNTNNRKPQKGIIAYYARMIKDDKWVLNGESIKFDLNGNLQDGQHRLMAVVQANTPIQSVVVRNVADKSYQTIDVGKGRTSTDSFTMERIPNSTRITSGIKKYIFMNRMKVGSIGTFMHGYEDSGKGKVAIYEHSDEYYARPNFWQEECSFAEICYRRARLLTISDIIGISAYLQLTKKYKVEVVHDFFRQIFFEECTENKTLAIFRRMVVNDAMSAKCVRMTMKYKTQLLVKCWDAFKRNKEYKVLRWVKDVEGEYCFE